MALADAWNPQKIAIVGAGIAGLSTALALVRTTGIPGDVIDIFEPRLGLDLDKGAAVNLNGGSAILSREYDVSLRDVGVPIERVVSRNVSGRVLFDVDVAQAFKAYGGEYLLDEDDGGRVLARTVMRSDLQRVLLDAIEGIGVTIHRGEAYTVRDVVAADGAARLRLADGSLSEQYNLVVGADGVRSAVRGFVAGSDARAKYTGFRVQWAIGNAQAEAPTTADTSALPTGELHQWFGDGGYALHYAAGAPHERCEMFALSFRDRRSIAENVTYASAQNVRTRIAERLDSCGMPEDVHRVFGRADRFIETGVYAHRVSQQWSRDGVSVLVGDAAHAMAPFLGQGANQAIQDAHVLALALARARAGRMDVGDALALYERVRRAPTEAITKSSGAVGWLEMQHGLVGRSFRDSLFTVAGLTRTVHRAFTTACIPRVDLDI